MPQLVLQLINALAYALVPSVDQATVGSQQTFPPAVVESGCDRVQVAPASDENHIFWRMVVSPAGLGPLLPATSKFGFTGLMAIAVSAAPAGELTFTSPPSSRNPSSSPSSEGPSVNTNWPSSSR